MAYLGKSIEVRGSLRSDGAYRVVAVTVSGPRHEPTPGFRDTAVAKRARDRRVVQERLHDVVLPTDTCVVCGRAAPLVDSECPDCRH